MFPALGTKNEKRNGGVPQEGNLTKHLEIYREHVNELVSLLFSYAGCRWSVIFSGSRCEQQRLSYNRFWIMAADFSTKLVWRMKNNTWTKLLIWFFPSTKKRGALAPYKDVSYKIEKKRHPYWPEKWQEAEATRHCERQEKRRLTFIVFTGRATFWS